MTKEVMSGIAFVVTDSRDQEVCRRAAVVPELDNNTAELRAICYALAFCKKNKPYNEGLVLFTDSTYALGAIQKGLYRPNEKKLVDAIRQYVRDTGCKLFFVKGHTQDGTVLSHYNGIADNLAKNARKTYQALVKKNKMEKNKAIQLAKYLRNKNQEY